eukprot:3521328-Alexandrium_andersonii.AAC.1
MPLKARDEKKRVAPSLHGLELEPGSARSAQHLLGDVADAGELGHARVLPLVGGVELEQPSLER